MNDSVKDGSDKACSGLTALIRLQYVLGAGNAKTDSILRLEGGAQGFLERCEKGLPDLGLLSRAELSRLLSMKRDYAEVILKDCAENGITPLSAEDAAFPARLRNIPDPPLVLYIKGALPDIDNEPAVCIVGPRRVSEFGAKSAYALSKRLAKAGFIIVSGGALGSDTFAHKGALKCGGKTIAVLGCGILYNYLAENRSLREQITQSCCLISEHPPRARSTKYSFPIRNRLMSALSLGTVVIEAGERSGSLITARHANEQGRDVFVIPGNPTLEQYAGSNRLLRDGARPLLDASDIFNEYLPVFPEKIDIKKAFEEESSSSEKPANPQTNGKIGEKQKNLPQGLSNTAKIVYNYLDKLNYSEPRSFYADDILGSGLADGEIISALVELEIEHLITSLPGGAYRLS